MIESFDYFVGKVCTVHTVQTNWKLTQEQNLDYFTGIVEQVNECGICLTNVVDGNKTFIMMPAVVCIAEEKFVENKEKLEKSLKSYEEKKSQVFSKNPLIVTAPKIDEKKVDVDSLSLYSQAAKLKGQS